MELDFLALDPSQRYKLLASLVVPRPIALISTLGRNGVLNAAPFSFFNALGEDPPIVIFAADARASGGAKDTMRNVLETREYVVNLVDEAIAPQMHGCAVDTPPETSEFDLVGFTPVPSKAVRPPRIAQAPVCFECRLHTHLDFNTRHLCIGEVVWLHARGGVLDPHTLRRLPDAFHPVGRLYATRYCSTREEFELDNGAYAEKANAQSAIRKFRLPPPAALRCGERRPAARACAVPDTETAWTAPPTHRRCAPP
ncbi:MAG: flavin reductase family protein [Burkholderiales bacterium]|nr:flavin reductase family protein [Burkholderiales bacterium]